MICYTKSFSVVFIKVEQSRIQKNSQDRSISIHLSHIFFIGNFHFTISVFRLWKRNLKWNTPSPHPNHHQHHPPRRHYRQHHYHHVTNIILIIIIVNVINHHINSKNINIIIIATVLILTNILTIIIFSKTITILILNNIYLHMPQKHERAK